MAALKRIANFTDWHKKYLQALKDANHTNNNQFVDAQQWLKWCRVNDVKTHSGKLPSRISASMVREVLEPRGYIEVRGDKYHITWEGLKVLEPEPDQIKPETSYHDRVKEMLYRIGMLKGRFPEKEYHINGERIDVIWKRVETGDPYATFEVQIGGNFYEALAKLKHTWDKWNSRPFLVTTKECKPKAALWLKGAFHEVKDEIRIIDAKRIEEFYEALQKAKSLEKELGIK